MKTIFSWGFLGLLRRKPSLTRHALTSLKSACRAQGPTLSQFSEREQKCPSIVVAIPGNSEAVSQGKTNCTEQKMPRHERLYSISAVLFYFVSPWMTTFGFSRMLCLVVTYQERSQISPSIYTTKNTCKLTRLLRNYRRSQQRLTSRQVDKCAFNSYFLISWHNGHINSKYYVLSMILYQLTCSERSTGACILCSPELISTTRIIANTKAL